MKRPREATLKFEAKYDVGFVDNDGDVHPVIVNDDSREEIVASEFVSEVSWVVCVCVCVCAS